MGLLYLLSPYDFFPDFMAIGWGWLDDLIILALLWRYLNSLGKKPFGSHQFYRQYQRPNGNSSSDRSRQYNDNGRRSSNDAEHTGGPKDPYEVLNIPRGASLQEIKHAYRELANKYHPDKVLHLGEEFRQLAEQRFKEIEEAYRKLSKE